MSKNPEFKIWLAVFLLSGLIFLGLSFSVGAAGTSTDAKLDSDGDGYTDAVEEDWGYDPLSTSTARLEQKIEINLAKQQLTYYVGGEVRRQFFVSTGLPGFATPKGTFKIAGKNKKAWSRTYGLWMPYWLELGGPGISKGSIGIHELPIWPGGKREGENHLGRPVSHGCIRLGMGAAQYVYDRAPQGTAVVIK